MDISVLTPEQQIALFSSHCKQYETELLAKLNDLKLTEEDADILVFKANRRIELLMQAIEILQRNS